MLGWKGDWGGGPDRRPAEQLSILPHLSEAASSTGRAAAECIIEKMGGRRAILSLSVAALTPAEGLEGGGFILTIRDLTEARDAMSDLRRTGDALRAVFEASPLGIISFDRTEKIQVWNRGAERIFGWTAAEAAANSSAVFSALGDVAKAAIGRAVRGESARVESPIRARSGDIDASLSIEPLRDAAGLPSGWIMAIEDVSARTRLENELRRSEAMSTMGAVVAGVAHEVRNPLFSITSALDAFGSMFADKPEALEFIGILRSEVRRLSHLMNELLDLSKPAPLAPTSVRLEDVVETVVRGQSQNAAQNSIELIHRAPQNTSPVRGDPERLEQVFQNLLENALQHAPAQSQIEMNGTAIKEAGEAAIEYEILDRGPGFREEDLPRLFQPFFSRRRDGTGLGLSIVQRVVEQHGGTVRAGNRPGGGAALVVRLPLADQHAAP
jgi:PAS domain S-box-containing protein